MLKHPNSQENSNNLSFKSFSLLLPAESLTGRTAEKETSMRLLSSYLNLLHFSKSLAHAPSLVT